MEVCNILLPFFLCVVLVMLSYPILIAVIAFQEIFGFFIPTWSFLLLFHSLIVEAKVGERREERGERK